ncbi:MAG TPA: transposase, partial [Capsulimonadaceae bacterium]
MVTPPDEIISILSPFASQLSRRSFEHVKVLVTGAILSIGPRTVTGCLRAMGRDDDPQFQKYHRVLRRNAWSSRILSGILLCLLVSRLLGRDDEVVVALDDTLERRWGRKIKAAAWWHDSARSKAKAVSSLGLRWVVMALVVKVPWSPHPWSLPFLTVLTYSAKYAERHGKKHKTTIDVAVEMVHCLRRWLPDRRIVVVADGGYAASDLLNACAKLDIVAVTRMKITSQLCAEPDPKPAGKRGPQAKRGKRLLNLFRQYKCMRFKNKWRSAQTKYWNVERGGLYVSDKCLWDPQNGTPVAIRWVVVHKDKTDHNLLAYMCTDQDALPDQILDWYAMRWSIEVTFQEVRKYLGVEGQRQWSDLAIERSTPTLMGMYSLVTLIAQPHLLKQAASPSATPWYDKQGATFADAIALVRMKIWAAQKLESS